jgi:hypothetical protein
MLNDQARCHESDFHSVGHGRRASENIGQSRVRLNITDSGILPYDREGQLLDSLVKNLITASKQRAFVGQN